MKPLLKKLRSGRGDGFSMGKVVTVGILIATFLLSMGYVLISGYE